MQVPPGPSKLLYSRPVVVRESRLPPHPCNLVFTSSFSTHLPLSIPLALLPLSTHHGTFGGRPSGGCRFVGSRGSRGAGEAAEPLPFRIHLAHVGSSASGRRVDDCCDGFLRDRGGHGQLGGGRPSDSRCGPPCGRHAVVADGRCWCTEWHHGDGSRPCACCHRVDGRHWCARCHHGDGLCRWAGRCRGDGLPRCACYCGGDGRPRCAGCCRGAGSRRRVC